MYNAESQKKSAHPGSHFKEDDSPVGVITLCHEPIHIKYSVAKAKANNLFFRATYYQRNV